MMSNFISGGHTGDLIHELYAIKNICLLNNSKANFYIVDDPNIPYCGEGYSCGLQKTYEDTKDFILAQEYINLYEILKDQKIESYFNMSLWRSMRGQFRTWTELLSYFYKFPIDINTYAYAKAQKVDPFTQGKVLIHHSGRRNNNKFNWDKVLNQIDKDILFITSNKSELDMFKRRSGRTITPYVLNTINEIAEALSGCDLFIGNMSLPMAIASSLDVLRICELHGPSAEFYCGEHVYSKNMSWYLDDTTKHNSENIKILV